MSMVNGGHLGRRVSDLLDGQLPPDEADAAWAHVHGCHACRDDVEREGWVKTRLSTLSFDDGPSACAPDRLKGALLGMPPGGCFSGAADLPDDLTNRSRSRLGVAGFAALGGGAAGAAVMGVLALGAAPPADVPVPERRQQPVSQVSPSPVAPRGPTAVKFDHR
jgi:hypothetical protein